MGDSLSWAVRRAASPCRGGRRRRPNAARSEIAPHPAARNLGGRRRPTCLRRPMEHVRNLPARASDSQHGRFSDAAACSESPPLWIPRFAGFTGRDLPAPPRLRRTSRARRFPGSRPYCELLKKPSFSLPEAGGFTIVVCGLGEWLGWLNKKFQHAADTRGPSPSQTKFWA